MNAVSVPVAEAPRSSAPTLRAAPCVSCRLIGEADLPDILNLLGTGFPERERRYWTDGLQALARHVPPAGYPRFGHMLEAEGRAVGVHLLICSGTPEAARCNVSSWFVADEFRSFATLLLLRATRSLPGAYVNLQPRDVTIKVIEAQGFRRISQGLFAAVPLPGQRGKPATWEWRDLDIPEPDRKLLSDHEAFGCLGMWCDGPVILRRRRTGRGIPCAQLIYARSHSAVEDAAGSIGRLLTRRGMPLLLIPSSRPLQLPGRFFARKLPIYCRGEPAPAACDLSYTEAAVFGM